MKKRPNEIHGHTNYGVFSPTYNSWHKMMDRCYNDKSDSFDRYGGRGIIVQKSWHIFSNFLKDMGERPENKTLDRIDNDGNYCLDNCRWATRNEQQFNRGMQINNTSGVVGVYFDNQRHNWYARRGSVFLGRFKTKNEAIEARKRAEENNIG